MSSWNARHQSRRDSNRTVKKDNCRVKLTNQVNSKKINDLIKKEVPCTMFNVMSSRDFIGWKCITPTIIYIWPPIPHLILRISMVTTSVKEKNFQIEKRTYNTCIVSIWPQVQNKPHQRMTLRFVLALIFFNVVHTSAFTTKKNSCGFIILCARCI